MQEVRKWGSRAPATIAGVLLAVILGGVAPALAAESDDCGFAYGLSDCAEERTDIYEGEVPGGGGTTTIPVVESRGGEPPRCFQDVDGQRRELPCTTEHGWWNGTCYVREVVEGSLPVDRRADYEGLLEGHDGEGTVISCYYPSVCDSPEDVRHDPDRDLLQCPVFTWAEDAEPVDPAGVAADLLASLTKRGVDVGVVPFDRPGFVGYVGLPSWYWVENPDEATIGPMEASDSSRGFTIVADTRVEFVEFDLDNGVVLECATDSLAFTPGMEDRYPEGSPDCGHVFTEQGTYDIVARSHWVESWAGLGQAGTREFELESAPATIRIGELQVLRQ